MGGLFSQFRVRKKNDIINWHVIRNENTRTGVGILTGLFNEGLGNFFDALNQYNITGDLHGDLVLEDQEKLPSGEHSALKVEKFHSGFFQNKTLGTVGNRCNKNCIKLDKIIKIEHDYCFLLEKGGNKFTIYDSECTETMYPKLELYLALYNGYKGESVMLLQNIINEEIMRTKDTLDFKTRYGDLNTVGFSFQPLDLLRISIKGGKKKLSKRKKYRKSKKKKSKSGKKKKK
jgi:hypothetical protein